MGKYIYAITSKQSGRVYIGQTVNPKARWYHHRWSLKRGQARHPLLQMEYDEFGIENLIFEVIELTADFETREKYWIDQIPYKDSLNNNDHTGKAERAKDRIRSIRKEGKR